jgi:hypothetical protein
MLLRMISAGAALMASAIDHLQNIEGSSRWTQLGVAPVVLAVVSIGSGGVSEDVGDHVYSPGSVALEVALPLRAIGAQCTAHNSSITGNPR